MKCVECGTEYNGNKAENLQGCCSVECREKYNNRLITNAKFFCAKNFDGIDYFYDPIKKTLEATISIFEVENSEYEKLLYHDRYLITIDPLRNKVTFEKH